MDPITRAPRAINPLEGDTVSIRAGGTHVYLSRRLRDKAGIRNQVLIFHNSVERTIIFAAPLRRNQRNAFSCRWGYVSTLSLVQYMGYVPHTTFANVEVSQGHITLRINSLRREIVELISAREAS